MKLLGNLLKIPNVMLRPSSQKAPSWHTTHKHVKIQENPTEVFSIPCQSKKQFFDTCPIYPLDYPSWRPAVFGGQNGWMHKDEPWIFNSIPYCSGIMTQGSGLGQGYLYSSSSKGNCGQDDPCGNKKEDPCKKKKDDHCGKKKEDPCKKKKDDPCGKKKEDPCKKKKEDPCGKKKEDPCKKKKDPCGKKKEDPCKKKKEDPCKKKKEDSCQKKKEDPCKKPKEDPCQKKEDPSKKPKEDPCKKKKEEPCQKKKEEPCPKKREDPCKKRKDDRKRDPCKNLNVTPSAVKKEDSKKKEPCDKPKKGGKLCESSDFQIAKSSIPDIFSQVKLLDYKKLEAASEVGDSYKNKEYLSYNNMAYYNIYMLLKNERASQLGDKACKVEEIQGEELKNEKEANDETETKDCDDS